MGGTTLQAFAELLRSARVLLGLAEEEGFEPHGAEL